MDKLSIRKIGTAMIALAVAMVVALGCQNAWCQGRLGGQGNISQAMRELGKLRQTLDKRLESTLKPNYGPHEHQSITDVVYHETDDFQLTCDFYIPDLEGPRPTILVIHGGGWRNGSKLHWIRHAWRLASYGYVVVSINYRHAPEYKFPAQIHDAKQAVRFLRKNADQYKIDPDQIAAMGYSAGGHLAALLGSSDEADGLEGEVPEGFAGISTRVNCVAAGGAPCEFSWLGKDSRVLSYFLGDNATIRKNPKLFERAYPTTYISPDDPPFLFYHDQNDVLVPIAASRVMHEKLTEAGIESEHLAFEGLGHIALFSRTDEPIDKALEFFGKHLKANAPADPANPAGKNGK